MIVKDNNNNKNFVDKLIKVIKIINTNNILDCQQFLTYTIKRI